MGAKEKRQRPSGKPARKVFGKASYYAVEWGVGGRSHAPSVGR